MKRVPEKGLYNFLKVIHKICYETPVGPVSVCVSASKKHRQQ